MINTRVEAAGLLAKLKKLEGDALIPIRAVVARNVKNLESEIERMVSVPYGSGPSAKRKGGKAVRSGASKTGQPPRKRTGRLQRGVKSKVDGDGTRGYVTVNATDAKGNRYPFMLESGTKNAGKRPFVKKAQRKIKKVFVRELTAAVKKAIQ